MKPITCLTFLLGLGVPPGAFAQETAAPEAEAAPPSSLIIETEYFAFHSDFHTNLDDALIGQAMARRLGRPGVFDGEEARACFHGLAPSAQQGWLQAVDWYAEVVEPHGWQSRQQSLLRYELAGLEQETNESADRFLDIARGMRLAAAFAYRDCRWPAQDDRNRAWIQRAAERVVTYGPAVGELSEQYYGAGWHGLPIRVDVVEHALPVGANAIILDPGGHVLASSNIDDEDALEIMFHEGAHTLMAGFMDHPIPLALDEATQKAGLERQPPGLWHVLQFYTTGEAVRRVLEAAGEPGYEFYMVRHGLWEGRWGTYREAVEAHWPGYLAGDTELQDAADAIVADIAAQGESSEGGG